LFVEGYQQTLIDTGFIEELIKNTGRSQVNKKWTIDQFATAHFILK